MFSRLARLLAASAARSEKNDAKLCFSTFGGGVKIIGSRARWAGTVPKNRPQNDLLAITILLTLYPGSLFKVF